MKKLILFLCLFNFYTAFSQSDSLKNTVGTDKVWRLNFINPGAEIEMPTGEKTSFSIGLGIGYGGSYPDLNTASGTGWIYVIAPFIDLQQKWFYNFEKRMNKGKTIKNNSGNFLSVRLLSRGPSIEDNISRTSDFDFAIGPTWGIQRSFGKFHLLFDVGPIYYFDTKGNGNIFPIHPQINLGFDL